MSATTATPPDREPPVAPAGPGRPARTTLTVVICTYTAQRWELFRGAARAVLRQLADGDQLVVVVDHDPPLAARIEAAFRGLTVLASSGEPGLSGARNTGVEAAGGEAVVFLDDDAVPDDDWLECYRRWFADPSVAAVAGAVSPRWEGGRAPRWFPAELGWVVGCDYRGLPGHGEPIRNPIGASMAVRRQVFDRVGGFTAALGRVGATPAGCEETDLCIRARQADPAIRIVRDVRCRVAHWVPAQRQSVRYVLRRCWFEGRSKARLAGRVGGRDGLSAERSYLVRVVLTGIGHGLRQAGAGELSGLARALVLGCGTGLTVAGFLSGQLTGRRPLPLAPEPAGDRPFRPLLVLDYDLRSGTLLGRLPAGDSRVRLLVFDSGAPVGTYDLPAGPDGRAQAPRQDLVAAALGRPAAGPATAPRSRPGRPELISVVIPTAGRGTQLRRAVDSVLGQDHPRFELIVVDNNPDPRHVRGLLADLAAPPGDPRLRLVHEPAGGSSEARNRGIAEARGGLIAATDDDVVAHPGWLSAIAAAFGDPTVDCVTGLVVPLGFATPAQELFEQFGGFGKGFQPRRFDLREHRPASPLYPFTAGVFGSGNNFAYRAPVARRLGGYDPLLGPGSAVRSAQDLDFFLRVILAGGTIQYEPRAVVRHEHRDSMAALRQQLFSYGRGLAAVMLKTALSDRRWALQIAWRLPAAARYLLAPGSAKNQGRTAQYPAAMKRAELRGLLAGTICYLAARSGHRSGK